MSKHTRCDGSITGRFGRVSTILREVISRRAAGEAVSDDQVIADHAEFGPELAERLGALRVVEQAELRARSGSDAVPGDPSIDAADSFAGPPVPHDAFAGYEIQSEIHRGGQGRVYRAIQQTSGRPVAIKVLREHRLAAADARARFEREVQVLSRLRHPNIFTILDCVIAGDACYLVMDYIAGRSLDEYLAGDAPLDGASRIQWQTGGMGPGSPGHPQSRMQTARAPFARAASTLPMPPRRNAPVLGMHPPLKTTLQLFVKIAWAVHAAHVRGIIHRDLKPSNVRIDDAGEPHVLDFGLAKLAGSASDAAPPETTMTLTGQFVGSLPWASPEQAQGASHRIDSRCDIYALGVMLYRAVTGQFPYPVAGTFAEVLHHILHTDPLRPGLLRADVNDELDTIILKCLAKDLERRYQSAAELARDLERFLAGEPIEARRDSTWYLIRRMVRRHRVAAAAVGALFVLVCTSAIWLSVLYRSEARARADAERSVQRAGVIQQFLQSMLVPPRSPQTPAADSSARRQLIAREVLDDAAARVDSQLAGEPEVEAAVRTTIGRAYHGMGLFAEARPHLQRALEIRRSLLPPMHADIAASLNHLGALLYDLDDFAGAEALFRQSLEQRRRLHPDGHPDLAESLQNLGWVLQTRGQYDQVEPLYAQALAMLRQFSGNDSIEAAGLLGRWGQLHFVQNHFDAARAPLVEARDMLHRLGADQTPQAAALLIQLGKLEAAVGRVPQAEALLREALELTRRVHGDVHPDVAWSLQRLGMLLHAKGCYAQAEPMLREACAMNERLLAPDSPYRARAHECLAALLLDRGDQAGAQEASQRAIDVWSARYRPGDPYLVWSYGRMGCVLAARGELDVAEHLLTSALEQGDAVLAEEPEQVVANLCALAEIKRSHGEPDQALARLSEALEVSEIWLGQGAPEGVVVMTRLGRLLTQRGDLAGAEPFLQDALLGAAERLGQDHPTTASCLHNLACWLVEHSSAHSALPLPEASRTPGFPGPSPDPLELARTCAQRALTIRRTVYPADHPAITESLQLLDQINRNR